MKVRKNSRLPKYEQEHTSLLQTGNAATIAYTSGHARINKKLGS